MQITYFDYNAFVIRSGQHTIAIDPGGSFYIPDFFRPLIPSSEWKEITHILVTHGDPDHHWHTDRVARESGAAVICNRNMIRTINGKRLMLGPRSKGLAFTALIDNLYGIAPGETTEIDGVKITGIRGIHGSLTLRIGPFSKTFHEGPEERMGYGQMGFLIELNGKSIMNMGDTMFLPKEWKGIGSPDVLMIPVSDGRAHNTMNEEDAVKAVGILQPRVVIPCHYNCPALFSRRRDFLDIETFFKPAVEKLGSKCIVMSKVKRGQAFISL